jgi:hypothetical protein
MSFEYPLLGITEINRTRVFAPPKPTPGTTIFTQAEHHKPVVAHRFPPFCIDAPRTLQLHGHHTLSLSGARVPGKIRHQYVHR